jgi:PBP1b-binding outer membrane lipoprotein LpoB
MKGKMKKVLSCLVILGLCLALSGCQRAAQRQSTELNTSQMTQEQQPTSPDTSPTTVLSVDSSIEAEVDEALRQLEASLNELDSSEVSGDDLQ